ncbi:MAG: hypothetical protein ACREAB_20900, partial [Blastocatellia bacterium]
IGVPEDRLHQTALWMSDFVRCLAPTNSPDQIKQGKTAAGHLLTMFRALLAREDGLLSTLAQETKRMECEDRDTIVANGIGFLSQAYRRRRV